MVRGDEYPGPNTNLMFITRALVFRGGRGDLFVGLLYTMEASVPFTSLRAALQRSNHSDAGLNSKGPILEFHSASLKFIYSEKATKFCEISTVDLTVTT